MFTQRLWIGSEAAEFWSSQYPQQNQNFGQGNFGQQGQVNLAKPNLANNVQMSQGNLGQQSQVNFGQKQGS